MVVVCFVCVLLFAVVVVVVVVVVIVAVVAGFMLDSQNLTATDNIKATNKNDNRGDSKTTTKLCCYVMFL